MEPDNSGLTETHGEPGARKPARRVRRSGLGKPTRRNPGTAPQADSNWAQGGRTSLENAALLCSKHHHAVHANNHKVSIGANGRATVSLNINRPRL